jgi:hypothetical protein
MSPYTLFIFCQKASGKGYSGTEDDFLESRFYNFFEGLTKYFELKCKFGDKDIKKYIRICVRQKGNLFNAYDLGSDEYANLVKDWQNVHGNKNLYNKKIVDSFNGIFSFCMKKKIYSLRTYVKEWGLQHLVSDRITDNVAYALGVHKLTLSSIDKMMIHKKFLKNVDIIKDRLENNPDLKELLQVQIKDIQEKLKIINPETPILHIAPA